MSIHWTSPVALTALCMGLLFAPPTRAPEQPSRSESQAPARATSPEAGSKKVVRAQPKVGTPPKVSKTKYKRASTSKPQRASVTRPKTSARVASSRAANVRAAEYSKRETTAPRRVKKDLKRLRKEIADNKYSFEVAYTEPMSKPITELAGLSVPSKPLANAAKQNAKARAALKGRNLMVRAATTATDKPRKLARTNKSELPAGLGAPVGAKGSDSSVPAGLGNDPKFTDLCSPSANAFSWGPSLTPIRNQGACGSCWAFAAVGTLEASNAIINGAKADLAEQHALSCSGGGTCSGGWYTPIYDWLGGGKDGLQTEAKLPYQATDASCKAGGKTPHEVEAWGWVDSVNSQPSVAAMKAAMCQYGPLTAAVAATPAFIAYSGGVFDEKSNTQINHAIVLVGWDDSKNAWLLRNSWGTNWGEDGYMWIDYNSNSVGAWATWAMVKQDANATDDNNGPAIKAFSERNFRVTNETGQDLEIFVQWYTKRGGKWQWLPGAPSSTKKGGNNKVASYTLAKGQSLNLDDPTHKPFMLQAQKLRVWAKSTSGKATVWESWKGKDLEIAAKEYEATEMDVFELRLLPNGADSAGGTPDPEDTKSKDELFNDAYDLFLKGKYADAIAAFAAYKSQYPSDLNVPYALYFMGVGAHELGEYWNSLLYFAEFADTYWDHDWIPYVYYWAGSAYIGLGECGYATQLFEVVIYGELGAPKAWIDAARDTVAWLSKDNGSVCTYW